MFLADNVVETANAPDTGTVNLLGAAAASYVTFASRFSSGSRVYYGITDGTQREIGLGTFTAGSPNTLSRDTVLSNTAGTTSKLSFGGDCRVYCTQPTGVIGEYHENSISSASQVAMGSEVDGDLLTLSLTPGEWLVWGLVGIFFGGGSQGQYARAWISTTSALDPQNFNAGGYNRIGLHSALIDDIVLGVPPQRAVLGSTATFFLGVRAKFAATASAYGFIGAIRTK